MGRIKTKQAKRLTRMLMGQSDDFTDDFSKNKQVVDSIAVTRSRKMRNIIAGYATRLFKEQRSKQV